MNVLLDTQALIWALNDSDKLTHTARFAIEEADVVYVSAVSFYEIAIKLAIGREPGTSWPIHKIIRETLQSGFIWLPLTVDHIESYLSVPLFPNHKDPFDRMLLATALADDLTLVSSDHNFPLYTHLVNTIW